jgi:hypothetical protein
MHLFFAAIHIIELGIGEMSKGQYDVSMAESIFQPVLGVLADHYQ